MDGQPDIISRLVWVTDQRVAEFFRAAEDRLSRAREVLRFRSKQRIPDLVGPDRVADVLRPLGLARAWHTERIANLLPPTLEKCGPEALAFVALWRTGAFKPARWEPAHCAAGYLLGDGDRPSPADPVDALMRSGGDFEPAHLLDCAGRVLPAVVEADLDGGLCDVLVRSAEDAGALADETHSITKVHASAEDGALRTWGIIRTLRQVRMHRGVIFGEYGDLYVRIVPSGAFSVSRQDLPRRRAR